jgi:predicted nucleic-acid-binding protein
VKGLDSSILLRYILEDDPVWSEPATRFIDAECTLESPGYINPVVLAEVVWSLRRQPGFDKERVAQIVEELLQADNFFIENEDAAEKALAAFKRGSAGFADCLIAALNESANASPTYSIDKDAIGSKVFVSILQEQPK